MQRSVYYVIGFILALLACLYFWHPRELNVEKPGLPMLSTANLPESMSGLRLRPVRFHDLFAWEKKHIHLEQSLSAFRDSCKPMLKRNPDDFVGSKYISLHAKDWYPACRAAEIVDTKDDKAIRKFFEYWFAPFEFVQGRPVKGLFTGYYIPVVKGSLMKTEDYQVPIYALPDNMVTANAHAFSSALPSKKLVGRLEGKKLVPYYTREEIDSGALGNDAQILAYVETEIDRLTIETEGSGAIDLGNDSRLLIGFAGTNGGQYKSIASVFVREDLLLSHNATMANIKDYFKKYPEKLKQIINQNKSFVFFRKLPDDTIVGSHGVPLTGGFSLAVDRKWIPEGMPLWLSTMIYDTKDHKDKMFDRLMIAQDAGGSIKGVVRGDIYFGEGDKAKDLALRMHSPGHYWLMLPRLDREEPVTHD